MIRHKQLNNVKYRWFKMNKLFGYDRKSQFKMNNYLFFYLFMSNSAKSKLKWFKNERKCEKITTIWQYSTVFDLIKGICFLCKTNRLACFRPIWIPNNKMNTKYFWIIFFSWKNLPKLTFFSMWIYRLGINSPVCWSRVQRVLQCCHQLFHLETWTLQSRSVSRSSHGEPVCWTR